MDMTTLPRRRHTDTGSPSTITITVEPWAPGSTGGTLRVTRRPRFIRLGNDRRA